MTNSVDPDQTVLLKFFITQFLVENGHWHPRLGGEFGVTTDQ